MYRYICKKANNKLSHSAISSFLSLDIWFLNELHFIWLFLNSRWWYIIHYIFHFRSIALSLSIFLFFSFLAVILYDCTMVRMLVERLAKSRRISFWVWILRRKYPCGKHLIFQFVIDFIIHVPFWPIRRYNVSEY